MRRRPKPKPDLDILEATSFTAECRGVEVFAVLERLQCPKQYQYRPPSGGSKCWTVPSYAVADVVAMVEHLGGRAEVDRQQVLI